MTLQKNRSAVKGVRWLAKLITRFQKLPSRMTPAPFQLLEISSQFWKSRALYTAAHLDIATILDDKTLPIDALAQQTKCDPNYLYRVLRMLASIGIFNETSPKHFANNEVSVYLGRHENSVRSMIMMHHSAEMTAPWFDTFNDGLEKSQAPFELKHGVPLFEYMDQNKEFDELFSQAMDEVEAIGSDSFATDFNWDSFDRLIDLGGSKGSKALAILRSTSNINALVVDREHITNQARNYWKGKESDSIVNRLTFESGDITEHIPPSESNKDIYFLCGVLHAFNDESASKILSKVSAQCHITGAKLAVMDLIVPSVDADFMSCSFDLQMMMGTSGLERTAEQWGSLFATNNLVVEETIQLRPFGNIMVVGTK
ncbi:methyltransferase [Vibrio coralliilyticus]|uniref:methyltransferase n=1 Tax=Vibrio coralliilyticus TaxID=190893 RepID=UPI000C16CE66|nr:methyltransferase [Vibrio coralliilyticus]